MCTQLLAKQYFWLFATGQLHLLSIHRSFSLFELNILNTTVWYEIIFHHLNGYSLANMQDIDKIHFDYCLDIKAMDEMSKQLSKGILSIYCIFAEL